MRTARTAAMTMAVWPAWAHANMSHISGGDALLVLGIVLCALAGIPALAAFTARPGRKLGNFAVALGIWMLLIVLAIAVPTGQHGGGSDAAITWRIAMAGLVLVVGILTKRAWRVRSSSRNDMASGHDASA
ncbi:MAG: hypothetical protein RLZZ618_2661 [Pseudomonadota bacterium]|jgi:peptidoglycan/LPS O-acetylase OafA/YrhL